MTATQELIEERIAIMEAERVPQEDIAAVIEKYYGPLTKQERAGL